MYAGPAASAQWRRSRESLVRLVDLADGVEEWLGSEPDSEPHYNCEVCGTVEDNRTRQAVSYVPGGTVVYWSAD